MVRRWCGLGRRFLVVEVDGGFRGGMQSASGCEIDLAHA